MRRYALAPLPALLLVMLAGCAAEGRREWKEPGPNPENSRPVNPEETPRPERV